ncbi:restriction endonuclease [Nonomuraea bangladeshensis]|uniref:restriction endonuclease n=1 Tax=Nonomuraea bangladeshensis TaxID=404385 RepID=UPI0031D3D212
MGWESPLPTEFQRLRSSPDAHQRGLKLEELLERLFQQAHFRVQRNAGIARPRQTDLVASYGDRWYLIEAKWENTPVSVDVLDAVQSRLERAASAAVIGVIISVSGFTDTITEQVIHWRGRQPILLLGEEDLAQVLQAPETLANLLWTKWETLVTHGRVHLATGARNRRQRQPSSNLPASDLTLLGADLNPLPYVSSGGGYAELVFVQDLPDVDWVPADGSGVCLDLPIRALNENGLADLLHALNSMGWITSRPSWSIQQATVNWHGIGAREFLDTLRAWKQRSDGLEQIHHTEQVMYFDVCQGGGFYTLAADVASHASRVISRCNVSFQLPGIPVDSQPLRHLFEQFDATAAGYFRPLTARAVIRRRAEINVPLKPAGYLVSVDPFLGDMFEAIPCCDKSSGCPPKPREWVTAILAENPFRQNSNVSAPRDWPRSLEDSELIVCSLRSHHPLSKIPNAYHLDSWEHARTSDMRAFRPVADW